MPGELKVIRTGIYQVLAHFYFLNSTSWLWTVSSDKSFFPGGGYRYPKRVIEEIELHLHDAHHPGDLCEGQRIGGAVLQCEWRILWHVRRLKEGGVEFVIINFQGTEELQLPTFNIPSEILNVVGQKKVRRRRRMGI